MVVKQKKKKTSIHQFIYSATDVYPISLKHYLILDRLFIRMFQGLLQSLESMSFTSCVKEENAIQTFPLVLLWLFKKSWLYSLVGIDKIKKERFLGKGFPTCLSKFLQGIKVKNLFGCVTCVMLHVWSTAVNISLIPVVTSMVPRVHLTVYYGL